MVTQFLVSKRSLDKALSRYADVSLATESKSGVFEIAPAMLAELADQSKKDEAGVLGGRSLFKNGFRLKYFRKFVYRFHRIVMRGD